MYQSPVELLTACLSELHRNLMKSEDMFEQGTITDELHQTHITNLKPKIEEYQKAINKLIDMP